MTVRFKEAMQILQRQQIKGWKLISLSIDPNYDRIDVLKSYRQTWGITPKDWHFCRGELDEIRKVGNPLGLRFETSKFPYEHNLRTALFDRQGRLVEVFSGNKWTARELATSIINCTQQVRPTNAD